MALLTMANLEAPYDYVESEEAISEAVRLLSMRDTAVTSQETVTPASLSKLQGLGKDIWKNIEPQQYVDSLRDEWEAK